MTNASTHVPVTRDPARAKLIRVPGDLGNLVLAPDGVMRVPIELDVAYEFQSEMEVPRLWMPATSDPTVPITFWSRRPVKLKFNGDDTPHIWGRDVGILTVDLLQFVDVSNGGAGLGTRLFDIVGGGDFAFYVIETSTYTSFKAMGTLTDVSWIETGPVGLFAPGAGFVIRATPGFNTNTLIEATRIEGFDALPDMVGAAYSFIGGPPSAILNTLTLRQGKPANSFLHIDSSSTGSYSITDNHYLSGPAFGTFFRPDESQTLTAQADVSIAITSFSDSAADPGVDTTANFGAIVDVKRGDVILISGEAAYDGNHAVVRVAADLMSFDFAAVHSTSGAGSMDIVEHTVSGLVRLVEGETVTISGTTNYNAVDIQVVRKTSDTTFTLPQSFAGNDATGTADSSGKDQTNVGVIARGNAEQEDSTVLGEACWNGNASGTTITDGTYVPLVLTGVMLAPGFERVDLAAAATGRLRYEGEAPIRVALGFSLFAEKAGASAAKYRITVAKNGAAPVFASTPYAPLELRDVNRQVNYTPTIVLDPGDEIQPMIAGDGFTAAVTVTDGQVILKS